jgi:HAE1 family hydrophobic/amphiphilic exporter-1
VELDQFDRETIQDVQNLKVKNKLGQLIELKQFAKVVQTTGPSKLERSSRIPSDTVKSNVVGRPVGTVGQEIETAVGKLSLPSGVNVSYQGQLEQQAEAFGSLLIAFGIGIVFVYLIMVALYESYLYPFVVLFSIPLAIIGALVALALAMETLNIFSILGMIMMMGLVAKNAILLVDFTNKLKSEGRSNYDALLEAGKERIRPILMTTFTMIFGMLPIALASGAASEAKNGLAWVLIGGLSSSMVLTLIVVPVVYLTFDNLKVRVSGWFGGKEKGVKA